MLAKCSRCSQTFQTDRYGEQFCPFCGAQVMIAAPAGAPTGAPTAPGAPPPAGASMPAGVPGAQDQDAPVDNPAANGGWFNAAVATWKKSVFEPTDFFNRLRPGPDAGGAVGYACAILAVGGLAAGLVNLLQGLLQRAQMEQLHSQMAQMPEEFRSMMEMILKFAQPGVGTVLLTPVASVVGFFINAALLHLAMMIVGGNKNGFTATLRAVGFATGPALFNVVPFCGGLAAGIWTLVLNVMALSGLHRVSIGRVIGGYAVLIFGTCCLCGIPIVAIMGWAIQQAAHSGGFDTP